MKSNTFASNYWLEKKIDMILFISIAFICYRKTTVTVNSTFELIC